MAIAKFNSGLDAIAKGILTAMGVGVTSNLTPVPTPSTPSTSGYTGDSIVDYLKSIKVDDSFPNRQKLAATYDISNYVGTSSQNLALLNKMRGSGSTPAGKPSASVSTMVTEVIKGWHGDGHTKREASLKAKYSNVNYQAVRNEVNRRLQ